MRVAKQILAAPIVAKLKDQIASHNVCLFSSGSLPTSKLALYVLLGGEKVKPLA